MQTGAATVENSMEFPQKTKTGTVFDSAIVLLGIYHKNTETPIQKNLRTAVFIAVLFTMLQQPKCPSVNGWIKNLWYICTVEYYAAERKKELLPFATAWVELENIMLREISQSVKDKYYMISSIRGI